VIGSIIGIVVGTLAAVLIATVGTGSRPDAVLNQPGAVPEPASIGTASDLNGRPLPTTAYQRLDGSGTATWASYRGTPLVINVWSTTCEPCKTEMPAIQRVHQQLGTRVRIVGLDRADVRGNAVSFARQTGVTYDLLNDPDDSFVQSLGIAIFPTTVFVAADGSIVRTHAGAMTASELTSLVSQAFP
jgi:thiol-disulfide isomerase/thioredoxin